MVQAMMTAVLIIAIIVLMLVLQIKTRTDNWREDVTQIDNTINQVHKAQERIELAVREEIARNREEMSLANKQAREELGSSMNKFELSLLARMSEIANMQKNQLDTFANQLTNLTQTNEQKLEHVRQGMETRIQALTEETRKELKANGDSLSTRLAEMAALQQNQLAAFANELKVLTSSNEQQLGKMRETIEVRVKELQQENAQKLDQMRAVVDEKLHATLEQRLGESFKLVSERLELVHKGLGEMQTLAIGVGDLKKVLTNVKSRGTWGEVQLGNILEDILAPDQYASNVGVKRGQERVEFAIKLPGPDDGLECLWLPIDAKFPVETYQRLLDAYEQSDLSQVETYSKQLENIIKLQAKDICSKYIEPPITTDFAIMFLPTEGLYAEVLRRTGLIEGLRREYKVIVAGPTTLSALISSLAIGFRTLTIQKRSSEVWAVLGAVKTEFGKFGAILDKTQKKLLEASSSIDEAARRSRAMERKLRGVEALPENQAMALIEDELNDEIAAQAEE